MTAAHRIRKYLLMEPRRVLIFGAEIIGICMVISEKINLK